MQRQRQRRNKRSIYSKIILNAIFLAVFSIVLATVVSFVVSYSIISDKMLFISKMLTDVAVEKSKTYLGEIADIINLSIKNENFEDIFLRKDSSTFEEIKSRKDYEQYLKHLILSYDNIDALIIINDSGSVSAANTVRQTYQTYLQPAFYESVRQKVDGGMTGQFYLDKFDDQGSLGISIVCPIIKPFGNELRGCVVAMLSRKFATDLQFAGDNIYLVDQLGTNAAIVNKAPLPDLQNDVEFTNKLNFEGWTLVNSFSQISIRGEFEKSLLLFAGLTAALMFLLLILVLVLGKWAVHPIRDMERQIKRFGGEDLQQRFPLPAKHRIKFKTKLLAVYFVIVTLPVVLITGAFYVRSTDIIETKVGYVFEYNARLLSQQLDFIFRQYQRATIEIAIDNSVQRWLSTDDPAKNRAIYHSQINQLILYKQMQSKGIMNVSLYDPETDLVYSAFYADHFVAKSPVKADLVVMRSDLSKPLWKAVNENYFNQSTYRIGMHVRGMGSDSKTGQLLGYIMLDFDRNDIRQVVNRFIQERNILVSLVDKDGREVLDLLKGDEGDRIQSLLAETGVAGSAASERVISQKLTVPGWNLLIAFPMNEYFNENILLFYSSLAELVGLLLLSLLFTFNFSKILSRGISHLLDVVRAVHQGDLDVRFAARTGDEIEEVGRSFNDMLDKLNTTINDQMRSEMMAKDAGLKAKEYELNLLQAQINPHFLYNTLRTAQYMVMLHDARAERMIELLIDFFKTGIDQGGKLIRLAEEIDYIKTYMEIQQIRFSNRYQITFDVPDELLDSAILKLSLQPIVENAIYHGFDAFDGIGVISISASVVDNRLCLKVCDNGLGMMPDKLAELRQRLDEMLVGQGIGIINVHERIRLHFGENYGITVDSERNKGTVVTIWLPFDQQVQIQG